MRQFMPLTSDSECFARTGVNTPGTMFPTLNGDRPTRAKALGTGHFCCAILVMSGKGFCTKPLAQQGPLGGFRSVVWRSGDSMPRPIQGGDGKPRLGLGKRTYRDGPAIGHGEAHQSFPDKRTERAGPPSSTANGYTWMSRGS